MNGQMPKSQKAKPGDFDPGFCICGFDFANESSYHRRAQGVAEFPNREEAVMSHVRRRWLLVIGYWSMVILLTSIPLAQNADETTLRGLVEQFFAAYAKEDLDGFMALWSPKSPDYAARKQTMQQLFAQANYTFAHLTLSRIKVDREKVILRAAVDMTSQPQPTSTNLQSTTQRLIRNFAFVKEEGTWKVWRYSPAADDLAAALVGAKTEEERKALLAEEKELVTPELQRALNTQGNNLYKQKNYSHALIIYNLAHSLAERMGYKEGLAATLYNIGNVHYSQRNYDLSAEFYQKSLALYQALGDKRGMANVADMFYKIGDAREKKRDYGSALEHYQKSLSLREALGDTKESARTLRAIGFVAASQEEHAQAIGFFQKSLAQYEALGDRIEVARTSILIGGIHSLQRNHRVAAEFYQKGLEQFEALGDKKGVASTLYVIAKSHVEQGNYRLALEYYQKSLTLSEELKDKRGMADVTNSMGIIHELQGDYALALKSYQRSLTLSEELGDAEQTMRTLLNVGNIHHLRGNYDAALTHYQKCLAHYEASADQEGVADVLNNIGTVHKAQGNYALALVSFQKSLSLYEGLRNRKRIATGLLNIGGVYIGQSNYVQALTYYQRSLTLYETLDDRHDMADALHNIGEIYRRQGNDDMALEHFQKSLAQYETLGDKARKAVVLGNIGMLYKEQGNDAQAMEFYQQSLTLKETLGYKAEMISTLNNMAAIHRAQGNYAQALEFCQKGLKLAEEIGDKAGVAGTLSDIGLIYLLQDKYAQALEFAERAAALAGQIGDLETLWQSLSTAGLTHLGLNQFTKARQAFEEAIAAAETLRTRVVGGEQAQQRFFESRLSPYQAMVELLIAQEQLAEALTYVERTKARVLLDVLHSGRVNVTKAMTAAERERERALNNQLVSLNTQIFRESQRKQPDENRLADLKTQLHKARLDYEAFQTSLYASHPQLKTQRGEAKPIILEETNALLPDAKTALLEFVVTETKTYLFVLSSPEPKPQNPKPMLKVYTIDLQQKDLAERVTRLRETLAANRGGFPRLARELYDRLLKPAQAQLQGKTNLVIVPDGVLWELPFQALQAKENHYLIEDAAIAYAPSLTVLREMQVARSNVQTFKRSNVQTLPTLLAFGNPALKQEPVHLAQSSRRGSTLGPLPHAEKEVAELSNLYGRARSKIYVGANAREERVKLEAGNYGVLHFATHGILNDHSPMYSQVLLAQAGGVVSSQVQSTTHHSPLTTHHSPEDGLLEAWEIMNLDLKANLVVLSACETARGRVSAGEGVIGLTWALFVAGCPTTVVSQWKVNSESTAELMVEFHRQFQSAIRSPQSAITKAEALRRAALKLMKNSNYRHPYHWAAFVLVGNGR